MSDSGEEAADKSFEPTPQKLEKARKRGEVARSNDLSVAAAYAGLLITAFVFGTATIQQFGGALMALLNQPEQFVNDGFSAPMRSPLVGLMFALSTAVAPWFVIPACLVVLSIVSQRGLVFAPTKLKPKTSRISPFSNARNKFGRSGLFEFFKSFLKLVIYSICLAAFINAHLVDMILAIHSGPSAAVLLMVRLLLAFLLLVLLIAASIGVLDAIWQHKDFIRKNRMTRTEIADESKDSEGDPHTKQKRRQRGQEIAQSRMMANVPTADVVIVNPTHFAVALKWSRLPGAAPVCVAKGVDEAAGAIRQAAISANVPIHHDPPTARALFASVGVNEEIVEDHYRAVAAAIRYSESMRARARQRPW